MSPPPWAGARREGPAEPKSNRVVRSRSMAGPGMIMTSSRPASSDAIVTLTVAAPRPELEDAPQPSGFLQHQRRRVRVGRSVSWGGVRQLHVYVGCVHAYRNIINTSNAKSNGVAPGGADVYSDSIFSFVFVFIAFSKNGFYLRSR